MNTPGMIRKVDDLGRIVIPMELRRLLEIESGQLLEMKCEGQQLVLTKFFPGCIFCGSREDLSGYCGKYLCASCRQKLTEK